MKPFLFFIVLLSVITYGSLASGETVDQMRIFNLEISDKVVHAVMYFLLTLSLIYGMVKKIGMFENWKVYLVASISPLLYGLLLEMLQAMVTSDRQAEAGDFLANLAGVALAFLSAYIYYRQTHHGKIKQQ